MLLRLGLLALAQGRSEEGGHLLEESGLTGQGPSSRYLFARWLYTLGRILSLQGRFDEAHTRLEEGVSVSGEMGYRLGTVLSNAWSGFSRTHLGLYGGARVQGQAALDLAREDGMQWGVGFSLLVLGASALAERVYEKAQRLCQEGAAVARDAGLRHEAAWASASLAYAARGLGDPGQARGHLCEALRSATEAQHFVPLIYALAAAALLLADEGQTERAVELYALASRYAFVSNSRWFEDVAGKQIAAAEGSLPPEVVAAAQERGRARDLWETARELMELEE